MEGIIFKNSKRFINEGNGLGKGILYCGNQYTNINGCQCGKCNGHCGPDNGCPCPECENTLSFILYSTGKMKCQICYKTLLRINLLNLKYISEFGSNIFCDNCQQNYSHDNYIPFMHCMKCNYNMCSKCAFEKIIPFKPKIPKLELGFNKGAGMIYCRQNYTDSGFCLCSECDGNCGPENGCPCPLCEAILGYNIYLKSINMYCDKCKNLLLKTTMFFLKKIKKKISFECLFCHNKNFEDEFQYVYFCYKCNRIVCKKCAFKFNIQGIKKLSFPQTPLFLCQIEKQIKENIKKEYIKESKICPQMKFRITSKNDSYSGNIVCIYLKTMFGRIYTINIDDEQDIGKLKQELRKIDNKFRENITLLIYKGQILKDDDYIKNLGIGNESLINVLLK